jgi:hypothetical protein
MRADKLGDALAIAGYHPRDVEVDIAIAKYLNSGGTIDGLQARVNIAAARMPGMGHSDVVRNDRAFDAQTRQPVEDGGANSGVPQGQVTRAPSSSSNHDERGPSGNAADGHVTLSPSRRVPGRGGEGQTSFVTSDHSSRALPVREPSRTERGLSSIKLVQSTIQKGLLELRKTADGRAWGSIGWHELDGMDRDGAIARLIKSGVNPPKNQHAELRSFLTNKQFEEICNAAKKQNDFV